MTESKYHVKIPVTEENLDGGSIYVDWYTIIRCMENQRDDRLDPAAEHAFKKIWALGERGSKSVIQDAEECIASLQSFIKHEQSFVHRK